MTLKAPEKNSQSLPQMVSKFSYILSTLDYIYPTGIFWEFSGAEIGPHSQWNFGDFFPISKKKSESSKKKLFFFKIGIFIQSTHTHTHKLYGDVLQFNGNSMCNSLFVFY